VLTGKSRAINSSKTEQPWFQCCSESWLWDSLYRKWHLGYWIWGFLKGWRNVRWGPVGIRGLMNQWIIGKPIAMQTRGTRELWLISICPKLSFIKNIATLCLCGNNKSTSIPHQSDDWCSEMNVFGARRTDQVMILSTRADNLHFIFWEEYRFKSIEGKPQKKPFFFVIWLLPSPCTRRFCQQRLGREKVDCFPYADFMMMIDDYTRKLNQCNKSAAGIRGKSHSFVYSTRDNGWFFTSLQVFVNSGKLWTSCQAGVFPGA